MGSTTEIIRTAIAEYQRAEHATPVSVSVSAVEDIPPYISGVRTVPSVDLNPGCYLLHTSVNYQPYWTAALKRHKALIAAGCISPVGAVRVAPGKKHDDEKDKPKEESNA